MQYPIDNQDADPLDGFNLVGSAGHGERVFVPTMYTRDGIEVRGMAEYNADADEWASVIETKIDEQHVHNSAADEPYTDASLYLVLARTICAMRRAISIYDDGLDDESGIAVPVSIR